jgi:hypothetical protein
MEFEPCIINLMSNNNILETAKRQGYTSALILVITFIIQGYLTYRFPDDTLLFAVISGVAMIIVLYTYRLMMLGILAMAEESKDQNFTSSTLGFIKATVISCIVLAFVGIVAELIPTKVVSLISLISTVAMLVYLGVASLRISKGFTVLEGKYTETAKRTVFWHKVTGYLLVTVILSLVGLITSLIADYFMWRLISMRLKESITSN